MANIIRINGKNVKDSAAARMASLASVEASTTATVAHAAGEYFWLDGVLYEATAAIAIGDTITVGINCRVIDSVFTDLKSQIDEISQTGIDASGADAGQVPVADGDGAWAWDDPAGGVSDVQINGVSVVSGGVANVPIADYNRIGAVMVHADNGLSVDQTTGRLLVIKASSARCKAGANTYTPIVPSNQHESTFYGLAKAAGDTTQSASSNPVGQYTDNAKSAIQTMLGVEQGVSFVESVSGTAVTITGIANTRYVCDTVTTISITPPATGTIDVLFGSGSTAAVLTVPATVKWPDWFDATALDADTTYELVITDGVYGGVMAWAD